jgi:hypothetical protein
MRWNMNNVSAMDSFVIRWAANPERAFKTKAA